MKRLVLCAFDISLKNWPTLLVFDMVYKAFSYSIVYSITNDLLSLILKTAGVPYLSAENLPLILRSPVSVLLCLGLIFVMVLSVLFETVAFYTYCEAGWQQQRISIAELLKHTLLHCKKLLHIQNLLLFLGFTLTTILTVLPFSPYLFQWLSVPEFMMDFIKQNALLLSIFIAVSIIANIICYLFLLFLPNTLFQGLSIMAAWKDGLCLLKKRKATTFFYIFGAFVLFGIVMLVILGLSAMGLVYYTKLVESPHKAAETFTVYFYRAIPVTVLITSSLSTIWLFSLLTTLFHQYKGDSRPVAIVVNKARITYYLKQAGIVAIVVFSILIFSETELGGAFTNQVYETPKVVAHRSAAKYAPENTMAALDNAISMGINMVEIDVQQLKDGTLILLHDDSFTRTTGINKKVWDVDYDEMQSYDAGSWFSPEFAGEPIPTLADILQRANGNIHVMIELKFFFAL